MYISSTVESLFEKQFNCSECLRQYDQHQDKEKMLEKRRKLKGCFEPNEVGRYTLEEIKYYTCVGNFFDPCVSQLMEGYWKYQEGVLPYSGSLMDQPAKIIEIFKMIDSLVKEKQRKKQEEAEKKHKARSRR